MCGKQASIRACSRGITEHATAPLPSWYPHYVFAFGSVKSNSAHPVERRTAKLILCVRKAGFNSSLQSWHSQHATAPLPSWYPHYVFAFGSVKPNSAHPVERRTAKLILCVRKAGFNSSLQSWHSQYATVLLPSWYPHYVFAFGNVKRSSAHPVERRKLVFSTILCSLECAHTCYLYLAATMCQINNASIHTLTFV